jgi:hypothetical protein
MVKNVTNHATPASHIIAMRVLILLFAVCNVITMMMMMMMMKLPLVVE